MLEKHEILLRIAEIEEKPFPVEAVGNVGKKHGFTPIIH